jgi:hypothetical protein
MLDQGVWPLGTAARVDWDKRLAVLVLLRDAAPDRLLVIRRGPPPESLKTPPTARDGRPSDLLDLGETVTIWPECLPARVSADQAAGQMPDRRAGAPRTGPAPVPRR